MYCWQFGCNGLVIMGRTWQEFQELINALTEFLHLDENHKLFVGVHNLAYEFQFMRKWFFWRDVFAVKPKTPISAEIVGAGVVFRCTMLLSGMKLQTLAENLRDFPDIQKQVGALDYSVAHNSLTVLTEQEITYCIFDVVIIMCYLAQCFDDEGGSMDKIPRTKTGYVRRRGRDYCIYHTHIADKKKRDAAMFRYRNIMNALTLTPAEYRIARRAFAGGFTHAQCHDVGNLCKHVRSMDFSSSYPAVCVLSYFPMTRGRQEFDVTQERYEHMCDIYCVIADVTFYNLKPLIDYEFYLSKSKCRNFVYDEIRNERGKLVQVPRCLVDNGRIVSAERLTVSITEIDFEIIKKCYKFDKIEIGECWTYGRGRLPTDFIELVADLYEKKTTLKGVAGMEKIYALAKADLNSLYGMMVTDILRDILEYGEMEWNEAVEPDINEVIEKYNKSFSRFTFYPWGVYVTASARARLWSGILACGHDYKYSDTDSIKHTRYWAHAEYFDAYNKQVINDLAKAAAFHKIPIEKFMPKTKKGDCRPLGVWDFDGDYNDFMSLGAKRYMYHMDTEVVKDGRKVIVPNMLHCTIAGVNPEEGAKYFDFKYGGNIGKYFNEDLVFPESYVKDGKTCSGTGKLTHTYINDEISGTFTDYQGRTAEYYEKSFIHLEGCSYTLSITQEFTNFLTMIAEGALVV